MPDRIVLSQPFIEFEERTAVDSVLRSGGLAQGPEVAAFEAEFSAVAAEDLSCVAVNSGTSALLLSLLAAGIGPGDEVVLPSFTFAATANAIVRAGATPVFADIEPDHFCLDPSAVVAALTHRTRAIMAVHLYGHPANLPALTAIANTHGLLLFEDAAQAHLASYHGRMVGTWGTAGSFSFYPTKNMTSVEGGMVTTSSAAITQLIRLLRNQGMAERYRNEVAGFNMRMSDVHAAIGRVQLRRLPAWTAQRRENAHFLNTNLAGVVTPTEVAGARHVYHQYTIRVPGHDRDRFGAELAARGVDSGVYYPIPVHRLPAYALQLDLPETERAASECLSLPVRPTLTDAELSRVVVAVNAVATAGTGSG